MTAAAADTMFDDQTEAPDEKPLTLSFCKALIFSRLDPITFYDLLVRHCLPRTGGIPAERLARILDRRQALEVRPPDIGL